MLPCGGFKLVHKTKNKDKKNENFKRPVLVYLFAKYHQIP